jgi:hypothetical protein
MWGAQLLASSAVTKITLSRGSARDREEKDRRKATSSTPPSFQRNTRAGDVPFQDFNGNTAEFALRSKRSGANRRSTDSRPGTSDTDT